MSYPSYTSFSSFAPGANSAPDLLVVSVRFADTKGIGLNVDPDLKLEIYKINETSPTATYYLTSGTTRIERLIRSSSTYYFVRVDMTTYAGSPIMAKWYAKVNGVNYSPYPIVQYFGYPSTSEVILLAEEVKDWTKRTLGYPLQAVELSDEQLSQTVDSSLDLYNRYIPKEKYGELQLIAGQTRYVVPEFGRGVVDVQFVRKEGVPLISDPLFGREYPRGQQLDFDQYQHGMAFFKALLNTTSQAPEWRWENDDPTAVHINAHNQSYKVSYTYLVNRRLEEINPAHHEMFRHINLAYAKLTLGEIRQKYGSIQAPTGNVTLNGDALKAEGNKELDERRMELVRMAPEIPPMRNW